MHGIYIIKNKVEEGFSPLEVAKNDLVMKRRFKSALSGDKVTYKSDFELYKVGEIDLETAKITACDVTKIADWSDVDELEA